MSGIDLGDTPVGTPPTTEQQTQLRAAMRALGSLPTANTVWVSKSGNDSTGARARFDLPFLTVTAAQAAALSGDTIIVLPGDYSAETALAGKDGVTYQGLDGAILPGFNVVTAITVKGSGLCQSLTCNNAGAVMDMPGMDTVDFIACLDGTQTAGNAGTSINCLSGTQTAGNAGTSINCLSGTQTAGDAETFIQCDGGTQTAGNAGSYIDCLSGTQTAGNAGTSIQCDGGTQTAGNAGSYIGCDGGTQTAGNAGSYIQCDGGTQTAGNCRNVTVQGSGNCTVLGNIEDDRTDENAVLITNNFSGTLRIKGGIKNVTGTSKGINYGTGVTGTVILDGVTIETTGKSIDAPAAQSVIVQGSLNVTQDVDADITIVGGTKSVNAGYKVF